MSLLAWTAVALCAVALLGTLIGQTLNVIARATGPTDRND